MGVKIFAFAIISLTASTAGAAAGGSALIEQGYSEMYNLQFENAQSTIKRYETLRPDDPLGPVSDAAACLFSEFDRLHILQAEFFVTDNAYLSEKKREPDPKIKARFELDLDKAHQLAAAQMQNKQQEANAMFVETLAFGLRADYLALIDRRDFAALSEIRKARKLAQRLLASYPTYYDAYLAIGVENYLLSAKPAPVRWLLQASGAQTDKQTGIDNLKRTAEHGHYLMPYARLLLAIAALRDGDKAKAGELLSWLATRYPRNTLYRTELKKLQ